MQKKSRGKNSDFRAKCSPHFRWKRFGTQKETRFVLVLALRLAVRHHGSWHPARRAPRPGRFGRSIHMSHVGPRVKSGEPTRIILGNGWVSNPEKPLDLWAVYVEILKNPMFQPRVVSILFQPNFRRIPPMRTRTFYLKAFSNKQTYYGWPNIPSISTGNTATNGRWSSAPSSFPAIFQRLWLFSSLVDRVVQKHWINIFSSYFIRISLQGHLYIIMTFEGCTIFWGGSISSKVPYIWMKFDSLVTFFQQHRLGVQSFSMKTKTNRPHASMWAT